MANEDGRISKVTGPVIDVWFPPGVELPEIRYALTFEREERESGHPTKLTAEVAQHVGDHTVRAICMQPTDGVVRGTPVKNTGAPIRIDRKSVV